jgi:acetyltransferase-like isoleucine patch superfamily enzyme
MSQAIIGRKTAFAESAQVVSTGKGKVVVGDYCRIGPGVKFVVGEEDVLVGDWTTLHDGTLVLGGKGVRIGAHCWFGQNCILDGSGGLTIGSGVRVGMYSQIWSHVAAGEQIEGCTLIGDRPVAIDDDVWLVGSCIVASGVTIGRRVVALIGSNVTKSVVPEVVIAGSPARPKEGLSFYRAVALPEKFQMLGGWVEEIAVKRGLELSSGEGWLRLARPGESGVLFFALDGVTRDRLAREYPGATICCVEDKTYNKTFSAVEEAVLRDLSGNKARFMVRRADQAE